MLSIKRGVDLVGVTVPMLMATVVANDVYTKHGFDCIITTGRDGEHSRASFHYSGNALDYRMRHIKDDDLRMVIYREIKERLGMQYDVIHHPYVSDKSPGHIHVEFQPKEKL